MGNGAGAVCCGGVGGQNWQHWAWRVRGAARLASQSEEGRLRAQVELGRSWGPESKEGGIWGSAGQGAFSRTSQAPRSSPPHLHFSCLSP